MLTHGSQEHTLSHFRWSLSNFPSCPCFRWWDWSLTLWTYFPSVLWHCWLGHLTRKNPSPDMTYNVFGGTLSFTQSINHVFPGLATLYYPPQTAMHAESHYKTPAGIQAHRHTCTRVVLPQTRSLHAWQLICAGTHTRQNLQSQQNPTNVKIVLLQKLRFAIGRRWQTHRNCSLPPSWQS